jgi:hypothetical protein
MCTVEGNCQGVTEAPPNVRGHRVKAYGCRERVQRDTEAEFRQGRKPESIWMTQQSFDAMISLWPGFKETLDLRGSILYSNNLPPLNQHS